MSKDICGDCKHYERGNAWSGVCKTGRQKTSPGVACTIARFQPLISARQEPAYGEFRQADYSTDAGTIDFVSGTFKPFTPMRVEVLSVVGVWSMVRRAKALDSGGWMFDADMANKANRPFVVETVRLDFGDGVPKTPNVKFSGLPGAEAVRDA